MPLCLIYQQNEPNRIHNLLAIRQQDVLIDPPPGLHCAAFDVSESAGPRAAGWTLTGSTTEYLVDDDPRCS